MIEKYASGGGQGDATRRAGEQFRAYLLFHVAHLSAQRRLRGVKPLVSCQLEAARFGNGHKVAKVAQFHGDLLCPRGISASLQSITDSRDSLRTPHIQSWSVSLNREEEKFNVEET